MVIERDGETKWGEGKNAAEEGRQKIEKERVKEKRE